jgi:hypothetical protein
MKSPLQKWWRRLDEQRAVWAIRWIFYGRPHQVGMQIEQMARAEIHFPIMDAGFAGGNLIVRGVAAGAFVSGYELAYGIGDDPTAWFPISRSENRQVLGDSLGIWPLTNLADTTYTLRLAVQQQNDRTVEDKIRLFLDRTPPRFGPSKALMIDGNQRSVLIEFATDDLTQAKLWWRNEHEQRLCRFTAQLSNQNASD